MEQATQESSHRPFSQTSPPPACPSGQTDMSSEQRHVFSRNQPLSGSAVAQSALQESQANPLRNARAEESQSLGDHHAYPRGEAPRFVLSISGPASVSLSAKSYSFIAKLTYVSRPPSLTASQDDEITVIFDVGRSPLKRTAPQLGRYSLYTSSRCDDQSRVPYVRPNVSIRAPREPDGRFKQWVDVTDLTDYAELNVGLSVSHEVAFDLDDDSRSSWHKYLAVGGHYWLRCDNNTAGRSNDEKGIDRFWRYGKLAVSLISIAFEG